MKESDRVLRNLREAGEKIKEAIDHPEKPWVDIAKCVGAFHKQLKTEGFNAVDAMEITKSMVRGLGGAK
jgi:hypothetical protein